MKIQKIGKIYSGQDGAIFGNELFRFDSRGGGRVYDISALREGGEARMIAKVMLDRADVLVPHSNAVFFGIERYEEGDPYPLLYSNVYNNYATASDPRLGTCCVYRILRDGDSFSTVLLQLIEIGFCEDAELWRATPAAHGVRPYGNFLIDRDAGAYYAYVMRDEAHGTRFFRFDVPPVRAGEPDPDLGVLRVVLSASDVRAQFDAPFYRFIQGGAIHGGYLYSTEGFSHSEVNVPAIRAVSLKTGEETYYRLPDYGVYEEPEMIDFLDGVCYYSDAAGELYRVDF